jgi:hypothetical protein
MNQGKAFDQLNPPLSVTDPQGLGALYPRHVHKAGVSEDGGPVYLVVQSPQEEAEAVADGWLLAKPAPDSGPAPARGPAPSRKR